MAKVNLLKANFNGGEISPRLEDRWSLPKVQNGCRRMINFAVRPHGGAAFRPGLRFIASAKFNDRKARLLAFRFSTVQSYMLEMGHLYFRFFKDGGQIVSNGTPYEVATTYTETQVPAIQTTQSADIIYLVHESHPPRKLTRTGHTAWTLDEIVFVDGPYLTENTDSGRTITPSAVSGTVTLTASFDAFAAADIGRPVRLKHGTTWGWAKITAVASATSATAEVKTNYGGTAATSNWRLGAWWQGNYPRAIAFHQGRLWFGGTPNDPAKLWGSKTEDYYTFALGDDDDDSIELRLAADDVHAIRWLKSQGKSLAVGTDSGEWLISSGATDPTLTPNAISQSLETVYGSAAGFVAKRIGNATLFLHRAGRKVLALKYFFENDTYDAEDLTILAHHITKGGLIDWAWQEEPDRILWSVRADGTLLGFTYAPQHDVGGWHRHTTDGVVEATGAIPGPAIDEAWFIVQRTVEGQCRRFIERMEAPFDEETEQADAFFVDCGLTWKGAAQTRFTGLDHLKGRNVAIVADGWPVQSQVVAADGSITLAIPASTVHAGLSYVGLMEPTGPDAGAQDGSAQGRQKLVIRVAVDVLRSSRAKLGPDENDLIDMEGGPQQVSWDVPPELFTGEMLTPFNGSWGPEVKVVIVHDSPMPFEIRSITTYLQVDEG